MQMVQGGYGPGRPEVSNHRGIWAKFTLDSILGEDRGVFDKPLHRKLQIRNKIVTQRFNKSFETQLEQHRMVEKAEELMKSIGDSKELNHEQQVVYEGLDRQRDRSIAYSNKRCSKQPSEDIAFSPQVQRALGYTTIWTDITRMMKTRGYVNKRWLLRAKQRWGIKEHIEIPQIQSRAQDQLRKARTHLPEVKKKAPELRQDFLDMLIQKADDAGETTKAKELRIIRDSERTREVHTRIKAAQGKLRGGGVKFVERIEVDGSRTTIKDKDEMEREIMQANEAKLHLANKSPL